MTRPTMNRERAIALALDEGHVVTSSREAYLAGAITATEYMTLAQAAIIARQMTKTVND